MKTVFEFSDYGAYLIERFGERRSGLRLKAAQAMSVHSTYLSQVLTGKSQLSLEQGERLNQFFDHTEEEGHFFLLLLQKGRAGTQSLKLYFQSQINKILEKRLIIKDRINKQSHLSQEDEAEFYSSWQFGAVRVLLSIPEIRTIESLTEYLRLPRNRIIEIMEFLVKTGLAVVRGSKFELGPTHIHLGNDSKNINKHHTNWRMHAINSLDVGKSTDLHYSGTITLSRNDVEKVKEGFISKLKSDLAIVEKSKEEVAYVYSFDFYDLKTH